MDVKGCKFVCSKHKYISDFYLLHLVIIIAHYKLNSLDSYFNVLLSIIMTIRKKKSGGSQEKITGDSY